MAAKDRSLSLAAVLAVMLRASAMELTQTGSAHVNRTGLLWSSLRGSGRCSAGPCVIPTGEVWVLDAPMHVETLTVEGTLRWDTAKDGLELRACYIVATGRGRIEVGTEAEPMRLRAAIYIEKGPYEHPRLGHRFFGGEGASVIEVHGLALARTWTLLSRTVAPGATELHLKDDPHAMGWRAGDRVGIATTSRGHSTVHRVVGLGPDSLQLEHPVAFEHWGGFREVQGRRFEMAAEVVNLERTVVITGDHDDFYETKQGLHTIMSGWGYMVMRHVRVEYCGQRDHLGRYCMHFHRMGQCPRCLFQGNAVQDSQQVGITVHGTHRATVDSNVVWDARGVGIYTEDGNEMNNTISRNVAICSWYEKCSEVWLNNPMFAGIFLIGMTNDLVENRVAGYENCIWTPGSFRGLGFGAAVNKAAAPLKAGDVVALHNGIHNRFMRMNQGNVDGAGPKDADALPSDWAGARFTVVDGGDGQIALHNSVHNRFVRMNHGNVDGAGPKDADTLPSDWTWERFTVVDGGNGQIALHNSVHNRFVRMNHGNVDGSEPKDADALPSDWTWERFTVVMIAEAPTAAPTPAPTPAPTRAPTLAPTLAPTPLPPRIPTPVPTLVPTPAPTLAHSPLNAGDVVALHNGIHNRFVRMNHGNVDGAGPKDVDALPSEWTEARFTVVDGGNGQIALHNSAHNRFVRMNHGSVDGAGPKDADALPSDWTWERFIVVDGGNGQIALHNSVHNRFVRMNHGNVDGSEPKDADALPLDWTWERFTVVMVAEATAPMARLPEPTSPPTEAAGWVRHRGTNCWQGRGAEGIAGADPLANFVALADCQLLCEEEAACEGVIMIRGQEDMGQCWFRRNVRLSACLQDTVYDLWMLAPNLLGIDRRVIPRETFPIVASVDPGQGEGLTRVPIHIAA